ncbi:hypothetical protein EC912_105203 [Luteibacter rhizovicinus]|uniref:Beta-lactamase-related domain-containing protein n=1 Tax=Luteibacter rhizovicinus TaxID=242606 RepID=A0A4R3YQW2_9GAMM|nr:serine hydrolase [Luteibacter rhizovicinus]TCV93343.1 hypothetical protein EC912_105203 [Luteibacter rhizovicinus]
MARRTFAIVGATAVIVVLALAAFVVSKKDALRVATNSVSRSLCTATFVSNVDPDKMFQEEQLPNMRSIAWAIHYHVDRDARQVRTHILGGFGARAIFRPGLGCLLVHGKHDVPDLAGFVDTSTIEHSFADTSVVEPTDPAIRTALDHAFAEPDPQHLRQTKALVVLHDGKLIAERYAPGYGPDTPIWGHSLSKSLTSALIGILVRQGKLKLDQPAPIAAWASPDNPHHAITIEQLLRMDSGLGFDETNGPESPTTRMWFLERDMTAFAAKLPMEHPPGTVWGYSNASYVLLSRIAVDAAGGGGAVNAERLFRRELFAPLGMSTAVIETDIRGTPIGSSHVYASARDFARFGQLYLDDGMLGEQRILPEGWVSFSRSQTLKTGYGAGFWTNLVNEGTVPVWDAPWGMPKLPKDMFYARGAFGQYVVIVPSEHLVVARLGISVEGGTGIGDVIAEIIAALHKTSG